jgi:hypothetical protein
MMVGSRWLDCLPMTVLHSQTRYKYKLFRICLFRKVGLSETGPAASVGHEEQKLLDSIVHCQRRTAVKNI